jgi:hypothetical protein
MHESQQPVLCFGAQLSCTTRLHLQAEELFVQQVSQTSAYITPQAAAYMVREFPIADFMVNNRMWPFSTMMLDTYSALKKSECLRRQDDEVCSSLCSYAPFAKSEAIYGHSRLSGNGTGSTLTLHKVCTLDSHGHVKRRIAHVIALALGVFCSFSVSHCTDTSREAHVHCLCGLALTLSHGASSTNHLGRPTQYRAYPRVMH